MKKYIYSLLAIPFFVVCYVMYGQYGQKTTEDQAEQKQKTSTELALAQTTSQLQRVWDAFSWDGFKLRWMNDYGRQQYGTKGKILKAADKSSDGGLNRKTTLEGQYISTRMPKVDAALAELTGLKFSDEKEIPKIGLVYSGGGYRAMTLTTGYQKAFEDLGILDGALYNVGLSGSTWFIGPWTLKQKAGDYLNVAQYKQSLIDKIRKNHFDFLGAITVGGISAPAPIKHAKDWNYKEFMDNALWPKILFGQMITAVDFWGGALAHVLLADFGKDAQRQRLSTQVENTKEGRIPWPIYTAASMHQINKKYIYNWYEFTPAEVRNLELDVAIPARTFGRKFVDGESKDYVLENGRVLQAPEQSFGFEMGIFGSAFTVSMADLKRIMLGDEQEKTTTKKKFNTALSGKMSPKKIFIKFADVLSDIKRATLEFVMNAVGKVANVVVESKAGKARVAPAQVNNPFKGYDLGTGTEWLQKRDRITFIDAGIDYNIPLRPMFRPERKIDLIFVGDSSGDSKPGDSLALALKDVKRVTGLTYEKVTSKRKDGLPWSDKTVWVYRPSDADEQKAAKEGKNLPPIIVYANFQDDAALIEKGKKDSELKKLIDQYDLVNYNAEKALAGYASTYNFDYTEAQFNQLSGWAEFVIKSHKDLFVDLIKERVKQEESPQGAGFDDDGF